MEGAHQRGISEHAEAKEHLEFSQWYSILQAKAEDDFEEDPANELEIVNERVRSFGYSLKGVPAVASNQFYALCDQIFQPNIKSPTDLRKLVVDWIKVRICPDFSEQVLIFPHFFVLLCIGSPRRCLQNVFN